MAARYLLDTNMLSRLVRDPQCSIAQRIARIREARVCTSIIVACELCYGAARPFVTPWSAVGCPSAPTTC